MNLYVKEFFKNFLFGGTMIGLYSLVVKFISPAIAGQAAGSLPIMFTYIIVLTYLNNSKKKTLNTAYISFFAGWLWQIFVLTTFLCLRADLNIIVSLVISILIFIIFSYIFYLIFQKNY